MSTRKPLSAVADLFGVLGSAFAVSAAVRSHRKPQDADLMRLGVDPKQFAKIRRY